MKFRTFAVVLQLLLAWAGSTTLADTLPPRVFPHPDRIRYDGQCFTIEGKDTFVFSGAFHYFRCPKELWNDRFDKIKAAGFNCVETYVAWNVHEQTMPASVDDYSKVDLKDLEDWLAMAETHGLYAILRPGPYICAEWDCGGFPQWLLTKKPAGYNTGHMWLRSDEPIFVAWSKHWLHAVNQVAVKHQITRRKPGTGGIIMYQLENEYNFGGQPREVQVAYLHALGQQALDDAIDVPLMTCLTAVVRGNADPVLRQCFDSCNFYPRWGVDSIGGQIDQLRKAQSDAPLMTTELQGGWFTNVGAGNSLAKTAADYIDGCNPAQIQNLTLYAIAKGDRITNYYMLFGGSNFGDHAPQGITTSYDYSAPIRESGVVGEKYQRVAMIGRFLQAHGEQLARATPIDCEVKTGQKDVFVTVLKTVDSSALYFFVRTNQHAEPRRGKATMKLDIKYKNATLGDFQFDYDLEPFGSKVLRYAFSDTGPGKQSWVLEPVADIARPAAGDLPTPIELPIKDFSILHDDTPLAWQPLIEGTTLEQLSVYDRRFIYYRAKVTLTADQLKTRPMLSIDCPRRDSLEVSINNNIAPKITSPGIHPAQELWREGENTITILYENHGQPNGGAGMEEMSGIRRIAVEGASEAGTGGIEGWTLHKIDPATKPWDRTAKLPELAANVDTAKWTPVKTDDVEASQLKGNEAAIFRTTINATAEQVKSQNARLIITRMDDAGWVFVNGKKIGEGHSWSDRYSFPVTLKEGKNSIAILVRNDDGPGGLGPVRLENGPTKPGLAMEIGLGTRGFAGKWWESKVSIWDESTPPTSKPASIGVVWARTTFTLPAPKPNVWVPWIARLDITGDAFLYLNGHQLGRYWAAGPQHDFYLPECWLNFGPGKTNVLTICGHGDGTHAMTIKSSSVRPLIELAETRP